MTLEPLTGEQWTVTLPCGCYKTVWRGYLRPTATNYLLPQAMTSYVERCAEGKRLRAACEDALAREVERAYFAHFGEEPSP